MRHGRTEFTTAMPPYLLFADIRSSGTNGGTPITGAWTARAITNEVIDTHNLGSVSANVITLAAGTYRFRASGAAYACDRAQHRLYNSTAGAEVSSQVKESHLSFNTNFVVVYPACYGRFTITGSTNFLLQYRFEGSTAGAFSLGVSSGWGDECYATVEFWREP